MNSPLYRWHEQIQLEALLTQHSGLLLVPTEDTSVLIQGELQFHVIGPACRAIADQYEIALWVPRAFPEDIPLVREATGRIPLSYHKLEGNYLCLGAPTEIRLSLLRTPTLPAFVEEFLVPYLYGYSYFEQTGQMPYGERAHGVEGIRQFLRELFEASDCVRPECFLVLAGMQKKQANGQTCPCGSGQRVGRCHNRSVNRLRQERGRKWCSQEYEQVQSMLERRG